MEGESIMVDPDLVWLMAGGSLVGVVAAGGSSGDLPGERAWRQRPWKVSLLRWGSAGQGRRE